MSTADSPADQVARYQEHAEREELVIAGSMAGDETDGKLRRRVLVER